MSADEQRLISEATVALRRLENGCPGLSSPFRRAVEAVRRMAERNGEVSPALAVASGEPRNMQAHNSDEPEVIDADVLTDALVAVRRASACSAISPGARQSLGTTVELLELLAPELRLGVVG